MSLRSKLEQLKWYFIQRRSRFLWQKITRGWTDQDTWSLDYTIAKFSLPRIKRLKEIQNGFPSGLTEEKWDEILDKIIRSFQFVVNEFEGNEDYSLETIKHREKCMQDGCELFGKYFRNLWW